MGPTNVVTEPTRELPVVAQADVVIVGGGPAGIVAAVASARTGAPGGRYVAACNTSPLDYIPQVNYLTFAGTIRQFRLFPPVKRT